MTHYYEMRLRGLTVVCPDGFAEACKAAGGTAAFGWQGQAWKPTLKLLHATKGRGPLGTTREWVAYRNLLIDQLARKDAQIVFVRVEGRRPPLRTPPAEHEPPDDRPAERKPGHYRMTVRPTDPGYVGELAVAVPVGFAEAVLRGADLAGGTGGKTKFVGPADVEALGVAVGRVPNERWVDYQGLLAHVLGGEGDVTVEFTARTTPFPADAGPPPAVWSPTPRRDRQPVLVGGAVAGWR